MERTIEEIHATAYHEARLRKDALGDEVGGTILVGDAMLDLSEFFPRERAIEAFEAGDAIGLLCRLDNTKCLRFVADNAAALKHRGIYENALVIAYNGTRTNNCGWSLAELQRLFDDADRQRLREAGDPIPSGEMFDLYRGVAGVAPHRKVSGFSWTRDRDQAEWFALRYAASLADPAVYFARVRSDDVLAYTNERNEDDFILRAQKYIRCGNWKSELGEVWELGTYIEIMDAAEAIEKK